MQPPTLRTPPEHHPFDFDPTYGYDLERLLTVGWPEAPNDYAAYWQQLWETSQEIKTFARMQPGTPALKSVRVYDITYHSIDGVVIGGWLTLPREGSVKRGVVHGHGYGGRDQPELRVPVDNAAVIYPCCRGLGRSQHMAIPNVAEKHVLHGIQSRDTYSHRGSVVDLWLAATALCELVPEAAGELYYMGGSFGGGMGAMALAWDKRYRKGHLCVPSHGNHPLRLTLYCEGAGEPVRQYCQQHPETARDVLPYFDAAIAAQRIHIPMHVSNALFDPCVPPPGQFSVYNALPGPKELFILSAGHYDGYPGQDAEREEEFAALQRFFSD